MSWFPVEAHPGPYRALSTRMISPSRPGPEDSRGAELWKPSSGTLKTTGTHSRSGSHRNFQECNRRTGERTRRHPGMCHSLNEDDDDDHNGEKTLGVKRKTHFMSMFMGMENGNSHVQKFECHLFYKLFQYFVQMVAWLIHYVFNNVRFPFRIIYTILSTHL